MNIDIYKLTSTIETNQFLKTSIENLCSRKYYKYNINIAKLNTQVRSLGAAKNHHKVS